MTEPTLSPFADPTHLLDWLHTRQGDPERKNRLLSALLRLAAGNGRQQDLAMHLMMLALWPGLSAVRRRLRSAWPGARDTLDDDIAAELSIKLRSADPDRITRVAATLLRNVERDLMRLHFPTGANETVESYDDARHGAEDRQTECPGRVALGAACVMGADGWLLSAVHLAGWSQKDIAGQLGIGHDAARKRCQRALARLREMSA